MNQKTQLITAALILSMSFIFSAFMFRDGGGFSFDSGQVGLVISEEGYREFKIEMKNNRYTPSSITVNQGDRVVINFTNKDNVAHAVRIPQFNASVPGGHVFPGQLARMEFVATKKVKIDVATCGGGPGQQTDDHGEELIINVV